ncbi:hypothetical protein HYQ46_004129 [Verticillium longisporum]|nr:hypothetical protein HYQ46_004129 [Verticillium longisporum]
MLEPRNGIVGQGLRDTGDGGDQRRQADLALGKDAAQRVGTTDRVDTTQRASTGERKFTATKRKASAADDRKVGDRESFETRNGKVTGRGLGTTEELSNLCKAGNNQEIRKRRLSLLDTGAVDRAG